MKSTITLANDEIYTALIALSIYTALISKNTTMDGRNKSLETARANALIDKLKKLVQHD